MARKRRSTPGPYLLHLELLRERIPDPNRFPYNLPAVRGLTMLPFHPKVTFLVGALLSFPGVEPLTPSDPALYCGQSAFRMPKLAAHQLVPYLREKHKIIVGEKGDNGFRVDIGYYISRQQLDTALDVFHQIARQGLAA